MYDQMKPNAQWNPTGSTLPQVMTSAMAAPRTNVATSVAGLQERVEHLHKLVADLESRLGVVLMPAAPSVGTAACESSPAHPVTLVSQLLAIEENLSAAITRLSSVYTRIEL